MPDHLGTFENRAVHHVAVIDEDKIEDFVVIAIRVQHDNKVLAAAYSLINLDGNFVVSAV